MGYEENGVALGCDWDVDEEAVDDWITADTVDQCLFEPLHATGMLEHATHYWVGDSEPRELPSMAKLVSLAAKWRRETVALYAGNLDQPDWRFRFALSADELSTDIGIGAAYLDKKKPRP